MSLESTASETALTTTREKHHIPPRRLSQMLRDLGDTTIGPIEIATIRQTLGDRSFAALLVLFALLNLLPLPPGATLVLGVPLLLITGQMVAGSRTVWLPQALLRRSISAERFRGMIDRLVPLLERLERLVKPRRWPFSSPAIADRVIGFVGLVLAIAVTLPIPFGNWLPAFAIAIIGLSLSERDGIFLAGGVALGIISLLVIGFVIGAAGALAGMLFAAV